MSYTMIWHMTFRYRPSRYTSGMTTWLFRPAKWVAFLFVFLAAASGSFAQLVYQYAGTRETTTVPIKRLATIPYSGIVTSQTNGTTGRITVCSSSFLEVNRYTTAGAVSIVAPNGVSVAGGRIAFADQTRGVFIDTNDSPDVVSFSPMATSGALVTKPTDVALSPSGNSIVVLDQNAVRRFFTPTGTNQQSPVVIGSKGTGPTQYSAPTAVAATKDYVLVSDPTRNRILVHNWAGNYLGDIQDGTTAFTPGAMHATQFYLYVCNPARNAVEVYTYSGDLVATMSVPGLNPQGVTVDDLGRVIVSDGSSVLTVFVPHDTTAPVTTSNVTTEFVRAPFAVRLTSDDTEVGTGVDKLNVQSGGVRTVVPEGYFEQTVQGDGVYSFDYWAVDRAGNAEATKSLVVKVDSVPPASLASVAADRRSVSIFASDNIAGIAKVMYKLIGGEWKEYNGAIQLDGGKTSLSYYAVDKAGNIETTKVLDIAGPELTAALVSPSLLLSGTEYTLRIQLSAPAGPGGVEVKVGHDFAYRNNPWEWFGHSEWTVTVPSGATFVDQRVDLPTVKWNAGLFVWAQLGASGASASGEVNPKYFTLVVTPQDLTAGASAVGVIEGMVGQTKEGFKFLLSSSSPNVVVPPSVTIRLNRTKATFAVKAKPGAASENVVITATMAEQMLAANVKLQAHELAFVDSDIDQVAAGGTVAITVYTTTPAPTGGTKIALSGGLTMPASVVVPAGEVSATIIGKVPLGASPSSQITVIATLGKSTMWCALYVVVPSIKSVGFFPSSVVGGLAAKGTVYYSGIASTNQEIRLIPENSLVGTASTAMLKGKDIAAFTLSTQPVGTPTIVNVVARGFDTGTGTGAITLLPVGVGSVKVAPTTVKGGTSATGTVTLAKVAATDTTVNLSVSNGATVPSMVVVKKGFSSATFTVTTSVTAVKRTVTVSAESDGKAKSGPLTVTP